MSRATCEILDRAKNPICDYSVITVKILNMLLRQQLIPQPDVFRFLVCKNDPGADGHIFVHEASLQHGDPHVSAVKAMLAPVDLDGNLASN